MCRFFLLALCLWPVAGWAQGERPPVGGTALVTPLMVDGTRYDSAWIFPDSNPEKFFIEAAPLAATLENFLLPERVASVRAMQTEKRVISLAALRALQISGRFDEVNLDLVLDVPGKIRRHSILNVSPPYDPKFY